MANLITSLMEAGANQKYSDMQAKKAVEYRARAGFYSKANHEDKAKKAMADADKAQENAPRFNSKPNESDKEKIFKYGRGNTMTQQDLRNKKEDFKKTMGGPTGNTINLSKRKPGLYKEENDRRKSVAGTL